MKNPFTSDDKITRCYKRAAQHLESNDIDKATSELSYVEAYRKIYNYNKYQERILVFSIIFIVSLVIISLAIFFHVQRADVNLTVYANTVTYEDYINGKPLLSGNVLNGKELSLSNSKYLNTEPEDFYNQFNDNKPQIDYKNIKVTASKLDLKSFSVLPTSDEVKFVIKKRLHNIYFFIHHASLKGEMDVHDNYEITRKDKRKKITVHKKGIDDKLPKTFFFSTTSLGEGAIPGKLVLKSANSINITSNNLETIKFRYQHPPRTGNFVSSVISARIHLYETGKSIELNKGDNLSITCYKCLQQLITGKDANLELHLTGQVTHLRGGSPYQTRNLMPTYLEYFYHDQKLAMIWTSLIFIFGLSWNLQKYLFRK